MRIFTAANWEAYIKTLAEFENEKSNSLIKTESLSLLTMPENVASMVISRIGSHEIDLRELAEHRRRVFAENLDSCSFTEIVRLFDAEQVKNGRVKVAFSEMLMGETAYYTPEEYILHLEHLLLLTEHENFHVHLIREEAESSYMVYAKEELGAVIAKTSSPSVVIAVNEAGLTAAFWDFLRKLIRDKPGRFKSNIESAEKLKDYIRSLRN
jgi:hypothetical protein